MCHSGGLSWYHPDDNLQCYNSDYNRQVSWQRGLWITLPVSVLGAAKCDKNWSCKKPAPGNFLVSFGSQRKSRVQCGAVKPVTLRSYVTKWKRRVSLATPVFPGWLGSVDNSALLVTAELCLMRDRSIQCRQNIWWYLRFLVSLKAGNEILKRWCERKRGGAENRCLTGVKS